MKWVLSIRLRSSAKTHHHSLNVQRFIRLNTNTNKYALFYYRFKFVCCSSHLCRWQRKWWFLRDFVYACVYMVYWCVLIYVRVCLCVCVSERVVWVFACYCYEHSHFLIFNTFSWFPCCFFFSSSSITITFLSVQFWVSFLHFNLVSVFLLAFPSLKNNGSLPTCFHSFVLLFLFSFDSIWFEIVC